MNSLISVRLASIADAEALSGLNQEFNGGVRRPPAQIVEHLHTNRNECIAVAELNGAIVGFGCAQSLYSFAMRSLMEKLQSFMCKIPPGEKELPEPSSLVWKTSLECAE